MHTSDEIAKGLPRLRSSWSVTRADYSGKARSALPVLSLARANIFSTTVSVNNVAVRLLSKKKLARALRIQYVTVLDWGRRGYLPKPFIVLKGRSGADVAYWSTAQVIAFIKVMNEFARAGYKQIPWKSNPKIVEHLHTVSAEAAQKTSAYISRSVKGAISRAAKQAIYAERGYPRFGVHFLSDPEPAIALAKASRHTASNPRIATDIARMAKRKSTVESPPEQLALSLYDPPPQGDKVDPFVPLHPLFASAPPSVMLRKETGEQSHEVRLGTNECSCGHGGPYSWHEKHRKWVPNLYCIHKLRVMGVLIERAKEPDDAVFAYVKALSSRHNVFEVTSAFHKELRRGDTRLAWHWGALYASMRGGRQLIRYLINILYEETRDHALGEYLVKAYTAAQTPSLSTLRKCVEYFCAAPKKWEIDRLGIFLAEMKGYSSLVELYGKQVAGHGDFVNVNEAANLRKMLGSTNPDTVQAGLKGLQKMQHAPGDKGVLELRKSILQDITRLLGKKRHFVNADRIFKYVDQKIAAGLGIGYHDVNAIADVLFHDEPIDHGLTDPKIVTAVLNRPHKSRYVYAFAPQIPLYAHDNHTWRGKALMSRYKAELQPSAKQAHLDFRYCGAYFGVAWRMLAFDQHKSISCQWEDVKWPKGLHATVMSLFY